MADALSRPSYMDQGENNNQNIILIPLMWCRTATMIKQPTNQLLQSIITYVHNHPTASHPGHDKTTRKTKQLYQWMNMNWIADYVKGCITCQQNKILTHHKKTPLYKITTPSNSQPFQQVAMDLIIGLPTKNGKDAILAIVDHSCL
jgi:Integrase zinc binding domain